MRRMIILLMLLTPFLINAQSKIESLQKNDDEKLNECISKISSDPALRMQMMEMMIEKTKNDKVELSKLIGCLMNNSDVQLQMMALHPEKNKSNGFDLDAKGMEQDSLKVINLNNPKSVYK